MSKSDKYRRLKADIMTEKGKTEDQHEQLDRVRMALAACDEWNDLVIGYRQILSDAGLFCLIPGSSIRQKDRGIISLQTQKTTGFYTGEAKLDDPKWVHEAMLLLVSRPYTEAQKAIISAIYKFGNSYEHAAKSLEDALKEVFETPPMIAVEVVRTGIDVCLRLPPEWKKKLSDAPTPEDNHSDKDGFSRVGTFISNKVVMEIGRSVFDRIMSKDRTKEPNEENPPQKEIRGRGLSPALQAITKSGAEYRLAAAEFGGYLDGLKVGIENGGIQGIALLKIFGHTTFNVCLAIGMGWVGYHVPDWLRLLKAPTGQAETIEAQFPSGEKYACHYSSALTADNTTDAGANIVTYKCSIESDDNMGKLPEQKPDTRSADAARPLLHRNSLLRLLSVQEGPRVR